MIFKRITISLPPELIESVDKERSTLGFNRSEFIRFLLDGYLEAVAKSKEIDDVYDEYLEIIERIHHHISSDPERLKKFRRELRERKSKD